MMTVIIGIDPGQSGAIALIDTSDRDCQVRDMPLVALPKKNAPKKKPVGKKAKRKKGPPALVDGYALARMLSQLDVNNTHVCIEKVGVMTGKESRSSMFNFGNSAGVVRGVCEAMGFPITMVTPQVWKKHSGLIGTVKDASRGVALKRYPQAADNLKRKRDGGRADAILIADWYASTTVH